MEDSKILEFFKAGKNVEFDDLQTSMITGRISFNSKSKINQRVLFDNLDIYEIPGWERPKTAKVYLPYPGIPYVILSARIGNDVKGILKHTKILKGKKKSGKLSERLSFDFSTENSVLNIMVYSNMIKVSGGKHKNDLATAFKFFSALVMMISRRGVDLFQEPPIATQVHVDMINIPFDLGYSVNKKLMKAAFKNNDKLARLPPECEELKICYEMGMKKSDGQERYYIFRVRHSGKVLFTGDDREKMKDYYNRFMEVVNKNEADFRFN